MRDFNGLRVRTGGKLPDFPTKALGLPTAPENSVVTTVQLTAVQSNESDAQGHNRCAQPRVVHDLLPMYRALDFHRVTRLHCCRPEPHAGYSHIDKRNIVLRYSSGMGDRFWVWFAVLCFQGHTVLKTHEASGNRGYLLSWH